MRFLYDHLNAYEDVEKVKSIGAQQLTQNPRAYLLWYVVRIMGLFEVGSAYEKNEIPLNKEMNQSRDDLKTQTSQVEELTKQLSEMKKQKELSESQLLEITTNNETMATRCSELEEANVSLTQEVEKSRNLNETLKKSLQDAPMDLIFAGNEAFYRPKAQALCIAPDLDMSKMDFINTVVDGQLVDMDEASLEVEGSRCMMNDNPASKYQAKEHEILVYF